MGWSSSAFPLYRAIVNLGWKTTFETSVVHSPASLSCLLAALGWCWAWPLPTALGERRIAIYCSQATAGSFSPAWLYRLLVTRELMLYTRRWDIYALFSFSGRRCSYRRHVFPTLGPSERNTTRSGDPWSPLLHFRNKLVSRNQFPTPSSLSARTLWCRCWGFRGDSHSRIWYASSDITVLTTVLTLTTWLELKELILSTILRLCDEFCVMLLKRFRLLSVV